MGKEGMFGKRTPKGGKETDAEIVIVNQVA